MAADSKKFPAISKKHAALVKDVKPIVDAYRVLVTKNGNDNHAQTVLTAIYQAGHRGIDGR